MPSARACVGQVRRGTHVGRQISQIALHGCSCGDRLSVRQPALGIFGAAFAHWPGNHLLQSGRLRLLAGLQVVDAIKRGAHDFSDCTPEVIIVELFDGRPVDRDRNARNPGPQNSGEGRAERPAPALAAEAFTCCPGRSAGRARL